MKRLLLFTAITLVCLPALRAQEWDFIQTDTNQRSLRNLIKLNDGGYLGLDNFGNYFDVVRYDANRQPMWDSEVTCDDDLWILNMIHTNNKIYVFGEMYVNAYFQTDTLSGNHFFIVTYDMNGNELEVVTLPEQHRFRSVELDANGDFFIASTFGGSSVDYTIIDNDTVWGNGQADIMLMTMDVDLNVLDYNIIGGDNFDNIYAFVQNGNNHELICSANGTMNYENDSLENPNDYDFAMYTVASDLSVSNARHWDFVGNGASAFDYTFLNGDMYFLLRQSPWATPYFGNDSIEKNDEYQLQFVKVDANGTLDSYSTISSTEFQSFSANMILGANDTFIIGGSSNRNIDFDQGSHFTNVSKNNYHMFITTCAMDGTTSLVTSIDDTSYHSASYIRGMQLSGGYLYVSGDFRDTVAINGELYDRDGYQGYFGRLPISSDTLIGIKDKKASAVSIYPNPANDRLTISGVASSNATVLIHDQSGRLVKQTQAYVAGKTNIQVNDLNAGVYFISIISAEGDHITTEKLMIAR